MTCGVRVHLAGLQDVGNRCSTASHYEKQQIEKSQSRVTDFFLLIALLGNHLANPLIDQQPLWGASKCLAQAVNIDT